jgi:hypothetical protein
MNTGKAPIRTSTQDGSIFVAQVCRQLEAAGYQIVRSFDFQRDLPSQAAIESSEDIKPECSCRMVVILVYGQAGPPVSLTFLGTSRKTSLYMNDDPSGSAGSCGCTSITHLLSTSLESYA